MTYRRRWTRYRIWRRNWRLQTSYRCVRHHQHRLLQSGWKYAG